jgi:hypothetical protein
MRCPQAAEKLQQWGQPSAETATEIFHRFTFTLSGQLDPDTRIRVILSRIAHILRKASPIRFGSINAAPAMAASELFRPVIVNGPGDDDRQG